MHGVQIMHRVRATNANTSIFDPKFALADYAPGADYKTENTASYFFEKAFSSSKLNSNIFQIETKAKYIENVTQSNLTRSKSVDKLLERLFVARPLGGACYTLSAQPR